MKTYKHLQTFTYKARQNMHTQDSAWTCTRAYTHTYTHTHTHNANKEHMHTYVSKAIKDGIFNLPPVRQNRDN